tara:strand:+ start:3309 stop:3644 length:336 start_codon:yes stop_codon:yes gene_type:complete
MTAARQILERRQVQHSTCCHIGRPQCGEVAEPLAQETVGGVDTHAQAIETDREHILAQPKGGPTLLGRWALHGDLQTRAMPIAFGEVLLHITLQRRPGSTDVEHTGDLQPA